MLIAVLIVSLLAQSGCTVVSQNFAQIPNDLTYTDSLTAGLRVHTVDGEIIIFSPGVQITSDYLHGEGLLYGLNPSNPPSHVLSIPRDQVAFMSTDNAQQNDLLSAGVTLVALSAFGATIYLVLVVIALSNSCIYGACS